MDDFEIQLKSLPLLQVPDSLDVRVLADVLDDTSESPRPSARGTRGAWIWKCVAAALVVGAIGVAITLALRSRPHDVAVHRPARSLVFPQETSIGKIQTRIASGRTFLEVEAPWTELGVAQGELAVPAGTEVRLDVSPRVKDLSPLARLAPDALDSLMLWGNGPSESGLKPLAHLSGLRQLNVSYRRFSGSLEPLAGLRALEHLSLSTGGELEDDDLRFVNGLRKLQTLWIPRSRISDDGLRHFRGSQSLNSLLLGDARVTGSGLSHLAGLPLTRLGLVGSPLMGDGLRHLGNLPRLKSLLLGDSERRAVSDLGDGWIVHVAQLPEIEELNIFRVALSERSVEQLTRLKSLRRLWLVGCPIADTELERIAALSWLESLNLGETRVTNRGLAALQSMNSLETLNLTGTAVTDEGLSSLQKLPNLAYLRVRRTKVTAAGLAQLQQLHAYQVVHQRLGNRAEIGAAAPLFTVTTLQGDRLDLASYRGKLVLLVFSSSWDSGVDPGALKELHETFRRQSRFVMIGLGMDHERESTTRRTENHGLTWPWAFISWRDWPDGVAGAYGVDATPAFILVDEDGQLIWRGVGDISAAREAIAAALE